MPAAPAAMPAADAAADLTPPDEFAAILETPDYLALPAHERAAVFDQGRRDGEAWLKANGLEDEESRATFSQAFDDLANYHRPSDSEIEVSKQTPVGTFVNRLRNIGPDALATAGGLADMASTLGHTALAAFNPASAVNELTRRMTGVDPLGFVAEQAKLIQAEGERLRPTNPDNPTANTLGAAVNQIGAMVATGGTAIAAGVPVSTATRLIPQSIVFGSGAGQGLDTARQMGIQDPLAQAGMGAAFGAVETLTEKLGGIGGDWIKPAARPLAKLAQIPAVEAGEEIIAGRGQDAITLAAGAALGEDANNPGFTESGFKLPALDADLAERMKQEAIGGAAGGLIFSGLLKAAEMDAARAQNPRRNDTTPAPQTPGATDQGTPTESEPAPPLPPDQNFIFGWEPIETVIGTYNQAGGGNLIADFGIQRTPEAQAIVDAENAKRAEIEAKARGLQGKAVATRPIIPDSPLGGYDILDFVNQHPLNVPRKGTELGTSGEYDWSEGFEMPLTYRKYLVSTDRGYKPDELAQMAYEFESGPLITEPTPQALLDAIQETMRTRTQYKAYFRQQKQQAIEQEAQVRRFDKSQQQIQGKTSLAFDGLAPGDEFTINDEPVKIRKMAHDEDGRLTEIVIEDGKAFGILSLDPDTQSAILVDKRSFKTAEPIPGMPRGAVQEQAPGGLEMLSPEQIHAQGAAQDMAAAEARWNAAREANNQREGQLAQADYAAAQAGTGPNAQRIEKARMAAVEKAVQEGRPVHAAALEKWARQTIANAPDATGNIPRRGLPPGYQKQGDFYVSETADSTSDPFNVTRHDLPDPTPAAVAANLAAAQMPRPQTPAGTIRAPGKLITLKGIRDFLLSATMLPRAGYWRFNEHALGLYKIRPEMIRMRALNDLPTLAHEVGHAIHFRQLSSSPAGPAETWGGAFDAELLPLGAVTSRGSYTKDQVRMEGVAEFTRLWLLDPAGAMKHAPAFAASWERQMRALHPEMLERLREAQRMISSYLQQPGWERAKAQLVFDAESQRPKRNWGEWTRRFYANWINTLQPVYDVLRKVGLKQGALAAEAQRIRDDMENHRGGWQSKVQADIEIAQTDLDGNIVGESLKNILAGIPPNEHADFSTYLVLKRAIELRGRGIQSGFEDALKHITPQTMAAMTLRYEATRKKLQAYQDNLVMMMVQSGLLDPKAALKMTLANQDYVPFYRLYERLHGIESGAQAGRRAGGLVDVGTGIRRIKGSDLAVADPLQSIVRNTFMFRKLAELNRIGIRFFNLMQKTQGHGEFADAIAPKKTPTKIPHEAVIEKLMEAGVITDPSQIDADLAITLWNAVDRPDSKTGEVIIRRHGKAEHWQINDPLLFNALKNADAESSHLFAASPELRALFTIPTRLVRFTATAANPVFALKNWFRDQITAGVYSKTGFVPFWDGLRGAMKVITGHPDYAAWILAGGKFSGLNGSDATYQQMVEAILPPEPDARLAIRTMRSLRHVKKALTITSEILEEATRVQEFSRARAAGLNPMQAANLSKNVSMNFARAGMMSRKLNQIIPFFNAGLQDIDMMARELANPKTRGAAMMKGFMYITIPSLIAWALGHDDDEIKNLPEWRRTQFWNFNMGPLAQLTGRPAFILSLPKPFLMGQVFGTAVERSLDQASGQDPNGAKKAVQGILENSALHGDVTDFLPALIKPLGQTAMNRDTFRDQEIVPTQMQHLDPAEQITETTSRTAQAIGAMTGSSPLVIDHLLRGYLTGLGSLGSDALDLAVNKATMGNKNNGPSSDLFEWQPFKSFVGSPYAADGNVSRFYNAANEMENKLKQFSDMAPRLDMNDPKDVRWWKKHADEVQHYQSIVDAETNLTQAGQIRKMMRHMSDLNRAMKATQADSELDPATKRAKLIELSRARNTSAAAGFRLFPDSVQRRLY